MSIESARSLVVTKDGALLKSFIDSNPDAWATEHMALRYYLMPPSAEETSSHPARKCYNFLREEYKALRACVTSDGTFSTLLLGRFYATFDHRPVGDGLGWDFTAGGDPEPRMWAFKNRIVSCRRAMDMLPRDGKCWSGNAMVGAQVRVLRAALQDRAAMVAWPNIMEHRGGEKVSVSGGELGRRWIANQAFLFLVSAGLDPDYAWELSRSREVFGLTDRPS